MKHKFQCALLAVALVGAVWKHTEAHAMPVYTATFDNLAEGSQGLSFSDGGLTFSDFDDRGNGYGFFTVDQATATLASPFTPPNALNFGLISPGPSAVFGRFGSAWIDFSGLGSSASIDLFSLFIPTGNDYSRNSISLEAWDGATLAASVSTSFTLQPTVQYRPLVLTGVTFDRLRLISSGPVDSGVSMLLIDNISVTAVPEPSPALLLGLSLFVGLCLGNRQPLVRLGSVWERQRRCVLQPRVAPAGATLGGSSQVFVNPNGVVPLSLPPS